MTDGTPDVCPECGAELGTKQLKGLCPKCMVRSGVDALEGEILPVDPDAGIADPAEAETEAPGRYTLIGEHARGGMGRVLVVHDESLGRDVALKELLPGVGGEDGPTPTPARHAKELAVRFLREAKITGQLEHPGITPVHELGRRPDGSLYYTMKLVSGQSLDAAIRATGSFEERRRLLPHFVGLCQAISYAHSRGVIHRDIKPSNVVIGEFGETVVVDWGLAKVIAGNGEGTGKGEFAAEDAQGTRADPDPFAADTRHGEVMGTPVYMSPEQARGQLDQLDQRSDVYSLGAVLYEILTGRPPFAGDTAADVVNQVIHQVPAAVRSIERRVPRELARICERAMARDCGERTPSAGVLARQVERAASAPELFVNPLRPFLSDLVPEVRELSRLEQALVVSEANRRWRKRNLWPSILQDLSVFGVIAFYTAMALVAFFALTALARDVGLAGWDEAIWIAVTAGFALPFVVAARTRSRSISPHVREVLLEREEISRSTGAPWAGRSKLLAAARNIAASGLVGAAVGVYVAVLLMSEVLSSPPTTPVLVGMALGVLIETSLLARSGLGRGRGQRGAPACRPWG